MFLRCSVRALLICMVGVKIAKHIQAEEHAGDCITQRYSKNSTASVVGTSTVGPRSMSMSK